MKAFTGYFNPTTNPELHHIRQFNEKGSTKWSSIAKTIRTLSHLAVCGYVPNEGNTDRCRVIVQRLWAERDLAPGVLDFKVVSCEWGRVIMEYLEGWQSCAEMSTEELEERYDVVSEALQQAHTICDNKGYIFSQFVHFGLTMLCIMRFSEARHCRTLGAWYS